MLNIPNYESRHVYYFINTGRNSENNTSNEWFVWNKPDNISLVQGLLIGGGGGGGGGASNTTGNANGGGGGSSGGITTFTIPAILLPDTLYIKLGAGLRGGEPNANGELPNVNAYTFISASPSANIANTNFFIYAVSGNSGHRGITRLFGEACAEPTTYDTNIALLNSLGIVNTIRGSNGSNGRTATSNAFSNILPTLFVTGGAGGGYVNSTSSNVVKGNFIVNNSIFPMYLNEETGVTRRDGLDGTVYDNPFYSTGGTGGWGNNGTGYKGGKGGPGSGGGGGGGGNPGGRGGNGGDGVVILTCY